MIKPRIKIFDSVFSENGVAIGSRKPPTYFDWYKGPDYCKVSVFTGTRLNEAKKADSKIKVGLIIEPPEIMDKSYERAIEYADDFDLILTHQRWLVEHLPNKARLYCFGGCWIEEPRIYEKSKNISMIFSWKHETFGQKLRNQIHKEIGDDKVDYYGRAHLVGVPNRKDIPEIAEKIDGLRDYRYSIAIENSKSAIYFSEKIIDCFATGTIPIYWGCDEIGNHFNSHGMIIIKNISDLEYAIKHIATKKHYYDDLVMDAIIYNYHAALDHIIIEDWLWKYYLKELVE